MIAIACAVATGPLLASAAVSVRAYVISGSSEPDDDGFSLDGGGIFIDPGAGGGFNESCDADGCWTVTGPGPGGWFPGEWWNPGGNDGGGSSSSGGGDGGGDPPVTANPTPCVEAAPASPDLATINTFAKMVASQLNHRDSGTGQRLYDLTFEWGAILYVHNGQLASTQLVTSNRTDQINWNQVMAHVPDGAVIVANLHFHPDENGINDAIPSYSDMTTSGTDWLSYDEFIGFSARGIRTDPNMLMYIHTNEPENSGTWVYDKTDRNTRRTSCNPL